MNYYEKAVPDVFSLSKRLLLIKYDQPQQYTRWLQMIWAILTNKFM
jgi:hypothetical protein